jgi:hypothetical protein
VKPKKGTTGYCIGLTHGRIEDLPAIFRATISKTRPGEVCAGGGWIPVSHFFEDETDAIRGLRKVLTTRITRLEKAIEETRAAIAEMTITELECELNVSEV